MGRLSQGKQGWMRRLEKRGKKRGQQNQGTKTVWGVYSGGGEGNLALPKPSLLPSSFALGERPKGFETMDAAVFPIDVDPNQAGFSPYIEKISYLSRFKND